MNRLLVLLLVGLAGTVLYFRVLREPPVIEDPVPAVTDAPVAPTDPDVPPGAEQFMVQVTPPSPDELRILPAQSLSAGLYDRGQWRGKPAVADLDRDGDLDLVTALRRWDRSTPGEGIYVFLGDPATGRWTEMLKGLRRDLNYGGAEVGDVNGDGTLDIAFSGHDQNPHVFLNGLDFAEGGWATHSLSGIETETVSADVALGDLDGDGDLDLAVIGQFPRRGGLFVFRGNGEGDFEQWTELLPALDYGAQVAIEDLNGDGVGELLAATSLGPKVWRYDGEGDFVQERGIAPSKAGGTDLAIATLDLDLDGTVELLVGGLSYQDHPGLQAFQRTEDGSWSRWEGDLPNVDYLYDIEVASLAPNAPASVLLAGKTGIWVLDHSAPGALTVRGRIADTEGALNVGAGDVDGDGHDEIIFVGFGGVRVLKLVDKEQIR
ncbi:MAG: VCBS repeat-containing protein [Planctomycetota bacterium]